MILLYLFINVKTFDFSEEELKRKLQEIEEQILNCAFIIAINSYFKFFNCAN